VPVLYADDFVIFLSLVAGDLELINAIFNIFKGASGLAYNMNKSEMTTIRCSEEQATLVGNLFPCRLVQFLIKSTWVSLYQ
jgi:hypothetical protein